MGNQPNSFVTATTNQYLTPSFMDIVLRDNFFFGELLRNSRTFKGSQVLQPLIQRAAVKLGLIYGETPNCAFA